MTIGQPHMTTDVYSPGYINPESPSVQNRQNPVHGSNHMSSPNMAYHDCADRTELVDMRDMRNRQPADKAKELVEHGKSAILTFWENVNLHSGTEIQSFNRWLTISLLLVRPAKWSLLTQKEQVCSSWAGLLKLSIDMPRQIEMNAGLMLDPGSTGRHYSSLADQQIFRKKIGKPWKSVKPEPGGFRTRRLRI